MDSLRGRQHFRTVPLAPATAHPHRECNGEANPWLGALRVDSGANHLELRGTGVSLGCLEAESAAANGKIKNGPATDACRWLERANGISGLRAVPNMGSQVFSCLGQADAGTIEEDALIVC